jgi:A/G-specific adenine glycosylase
VHNHDGDSLINILQEQFSVPLLYWYDEHGRKNLPWQSPRDPYRVWISEIMLQQTQVQTVIPYFNRFIASFPTVQDLAQAEEDQVLALWSGLGYYSRARNIHKSAKTIHLNYAGLLPKDLNLLIDLPGIGPSTAGAILSQAYNLPTAILDGNVKRVLTRFFRIEGWPEQAQIKKMLWQLADECMPKERCADYTQAIMDLGATCCTLKKPNCSQCPLQLNCQALKHNEQALYPTKKIKKPVPVHHQLFLIVRNKKNMIYLEKRPPIGLWGGLWCFPAIDKGLCPLSHIKEHYQVQGTNLKHILSLKHRFSHFHLEIDALMIETHDVQNTIAETSGQWFTQEKLTKVGLAKPTSLILKQLFEAAS